MKMIKKLNENGINNSVFPANTSSNYPSFIKIHGNFLILSNIGSKLLQLKIDRGLMSNF